MCSKTFGNIVFFSFGIQLLMNLSAHQYFVILIVAHIHSHDSTNCNTDICPHSAQGIICSPTQVVEQAEGLEFCLMLILSLTVAFQQPAQTLLQVYVIDVWVEELQRCTT